MTSTAAVIATTRFGLGPTPEELRHVASDPRGWLVEQLAGPDARAERLLSRRLPTEGTVSSMGSAMAQRDPEVRKERLQANAALWKEEAAAHLEVAASSHKPFRERLVAHWANHFTVSVARKEVMGVAVGFERDVIRKHLDGHFADMLIASTRHPAMLGYLDNVKSMGPGSRAGTRQGAGLNENLAREVLELHTLGVDGGYSQADVTSFAMLLTGWSLGVKGGTRAALTQLAMGTGPELTGGFGFQAMRHQPGTKRLLGRSYPEGEEGGVKALRDLAAHPATATHVAKRLVAHFVDDVPPDPAVSIVAEAFRDSDGHLPTVHRALLDLPVWKRPLTKVKTPRDLVLSVARGLGFASEGEAMRDGMHLLGQTPYRAPSPKGWSDSASAWTGPEQVLGRIEWLERVAKRAGGSGREVAEALFGPVMSRSTRRALADDDNLWVALCSPEFQRR